MVVVSPQGGTRSCRHHFRRANRAHRPLSRRFRLFSGSNGLAAHCTQSHRMLQIRTGLAAFPLQKDGSLGTAKFLRRKRWLSVLYRIPVTSGPDTFIVGYAVGDGCSMCTVEKDGDGQHRPELVQDRYKALACRPSCAGSRSPRMTGRLYATNFGYSKHLQLPHQWPRPGNRARSRVCPQGSRGTAPPGGLNGTVTSGPADSWDHVGRCVSLFRSTGNAAKLIGYATQPDGSLTEVTSVQDSLQQSARGLRDSDFTLANPRIGA